MATTTVKKRRRLNLSRREAMWAYILISPWIIGFIIFTAGPMIVSAYYSLTEYDVINPPRFVGLENWRAMFVEDNLFWHSLKVTLTYAVAAISMGLVFGLALALLLNAKVPGLTIWRTLFYMPSVVSGVAVSVLWSYIFNPRFGIVNWILSWFSIKGPGWLGSVDWALPALIVMSLWSVGGGMIVYLAGLQSIPTTLYEAATIDGANTWQRFWSITLPLITPVILVNIIYTIIDSFTDYFNRVLFYIRLVTFRTQLRIGYPSAVGMGLRGALFVLIFRQFFRGMPWELEDAARIDGAGPIRVFFNVMLPPAQPAIAVVFLFSFVWHWNDSLQPAIFLNDTDLFTLMVTTQACVHNKLYV